VVEVRESDAFAEWFADLDDERARAKILVRIRRLSLGNPGDVKPVGEGVSELRIRHGPGYRVYYVRRGAGPAILLGGGDKRTQAGDVKAALALARALKKDDDDDD
jgi:putative addiction module killer protein